MKVMAAYDSVHGNTEKIAQAIGGQVLQAGQVTLTDLKGFGLLIVGSPTHGRFPTKGIYGLLKAPLALEGVNVAAFDKR